jgi:hypothetical protein
MKLLTTIRRAFGKDTDVFQCKPCGLSIAETAKGQKLQEAATLEPKSHEW